VAGQQITTGDYNIDIGNIGVAGDANTIRIGDDNQGATYVAGIYGVSVAGLAVAMDLFGRLGTVGSSRRFKKEIKPMDKASEAILALKPVTFRYKKEIDPAGTSQFGLVAEEVEKVNADLVVRDKEGKPYSVRYDQVNAMLLNEFLKEHRKVQKLETALETLSERLKAQDAKIQKVSAQVELNKAATKLANENR
jgi:Chaperone of endosialidase